ncbi:sulfite reductase flavoprotein subunit alpha [Acidovorax sp. NCPPB 3576]|uniref:sulfite reductase flavoprotein subunit alpha n=1 Tax=Acidovorax sp. NCPPB 3576 TaxID=2940488 RepID=UPI0023499AD5|nr:sulfite reductase flavoprotein subunit alpha [Acidovorax sp. NCPPB 3576]WCM90987.1 sulfite reductase flavoprotein subunit alpha [Acidovorax sp. NCPPB 3576]
MPSLRQAWFQVHWFLGITAGTVLVVIGLSGALLSFHEEILDALNPGVRQVTPRAGPMLTPQQIVDAVARVPGHPRISTLTVQSQPGAAARVIFQARPGERRGDTVYVHPYTGALQPDLKGQDAFEWIEALHRWLLLPREPGRVATGVLALCLLALSLSGLYLRWPRHPLRWRTWLTFDTALKGRSFLWALHSVVGTWALVVYLMLTATGLYWAFDAVRDTVDGWAGLPRPARAAAAPRAGVKAGPDANEAAPLDLTRAWRTFEQRAGPWTQASLRLPARPTQAVQFTWLAADATHDRQRNRMSIEPLTGEVPVDDRHAQRGAAARALATIYPLHMGTYFGLPGRLAVMFASLAMPLFAITGWMLYLGRRRQRRATEAARAAHGHSMPPMAGRDQNADTLLVAYASQAGQAERVALQSAAALQRAGLGLAVQSLQALTPGMLTAHRRVLLVASSFGEGEPPDNARRFARLLAHQPADSLKGVRYGLLALGDRNYTRFCGFGHALDEGLRRAGAEPLFPLIEVDDADPAALARWTEALAALEGAEHLAMNVDLAEGTPSPVYAPWRLARRECLNPGSLGHPLFEVSLTHSDPADWHPGALVEVLPRHAPQAVAAWLHAAGADGAAPVQHEGERTTLADALAVSVLPQPPLEFAGAQACADALVALAPRTYSVASLPGDGALQLLVRQERHAQGLGLASGWLTAHASLGAEVALRLVANPRFDSAPGDAPCIFIGNGSGLAGLRSHLRARVRAGHRRNWLLFGERQRAHDDLCAEEIGGWQNQGFLERLDRVFSRDGEAHRHVQDRLRDAADDLREWVAQGAVVYVCGSAEGMAAGVDAALVEVLGADAVDALITDGRYRRDVY